MAKADSYKFLPVGKLYKTTSFSNRYFNRNYFTILRERLPEIFLGDVRVKPSNKYLKYNLISQRAQMVVLLRVKAERRS